MSNPIQRIQDPSQLESLTVWRLKPPRPPTGVHVEAEGPSPERVRSWNRRLTELQAACGCEQGALGLLAGLLGYLAFLFLRPGGWNDPGWHEFWVGAGVVTVTTSVGKFLGLAAAQRELNRLIKEIRSEWPPRPSARGIP